MEKNRQGARLLLFAAFFLVIVWLWGALGQKLSPHFEIVPWIVFQNVLYFIMGIILNSVGKRLDFHSVRVNGFRLAVVLVCALLVVLCYVLYGRLPKEIPERLDIIELLLVTYAGANLLPALHLYRE